MDFTLTPGDVVTIEIEEVGTLTNPVVAGKPELSWLAVPPAASPARSSAFATTAQQSTPGHGGRPARP
jgi:hypothetical protein